MEVTYNSNRANMWRCNLYAATHRPSAVASLLLWPAGISGEYLYVFYQKSHSLSLQTGIVVVAVIFSAYFSLQVLALYVGIHTKLPRPDSHRICTTTIMPNGVRDISPERAQLIIWSDITTIRYHQGDIYFWTSFKGIFVPQSAFASPNETRQFYTMALDFWRNPAVNTISSYTQSIVLNEKLEEGETVLWRRGGNLKVSDYLFSFMPITLLIIGVLATAFTVITTGFTGIKALVGIWIGLVGFVAINLSAYQNIARKLQYALTDKRILALLPQRRGESKFLTIEYGQIEVFQYYVISPDVATFKFLTATEVIVFYEVSDSITVSDVVAKRRGKQPANFEALFTSHLNSDPFLSILHQDESVLWQGQSERIGHEMFRKSAARFYAVTNQRLLLLDRGKFTFFAEANLAGINKMNYEAHSSDVGTLSFGGPYNSYLEFESLADPREVRRIISEAKQKISGKAMEWKDITSKRTK